MKSLNRPGLLNHLKAMQGRIEYESEEDEGAQEFYGEIQSVIDAVKAGKTDAEIQDAADWVSISIDAFWVSK